ncbi:MAG: GatB/YqeY domain-containing protein [Candidatus Marinimicrobia bacterium]|nr:GatB/YqeY domain-containing protein [Candidatus Neomarinimicrobiota bacterium]
MLSTLMNDMKSAMKAGEKSELGALRNLIGKVKAKQIDSGKTLTDDECIKVMATAAKQLKDSIQQYKDGGRDDLAENEAFELSIVERYLPEQMSEDDVRAIVKKTIADVGAESMKDMGKVMGAAMQAVGSGSDGSIVQKMVREELS